jgi:uncharacterized membrane protein
MTTSRMEAYSDAVLAIIITIMVLELKVPHGTDLAGLLALWPRFLSYALSFLVLSIFWVNHHRIMHMAKRADNGVLWFNNLLLFCLSLVPFATAYMGENHFEPVATALYAAVQCCAALCYRALWLSISRHHREERDFEAVMRAAKRKNLVGVAIFAAAVPVAFIYPYCTLGMTFIVAAIYFIPEMWVERGAKVCGLGALVSDS